MNQQIVQIALVVRDYDEAIDFYVNKLHFDLIEDTDRGNGKRWVIVKPKGKGGCALLLAKAKNEKQAEAIGNQTGGRVFLFIYTDNFDRDYDNLIKNNIKIFRDASIEDFGKVAVFEDLYGNLWDMIEPK